MGAEEHARGSRDGDRLANARRRAGSFTRVHILGRGRRSARRAARRSLRPGSLAKARRTHSGARPHVCEAFSQSGRPAHAHARKCATVSLASTNRGNLVNTSRASCDHLLYAKPSANLGGISLAKQPSRLPCVLMLVLINCSSSVTPKKVICC